MEINWKSQCVKFKQLFICRPTSIIRYQLLQLNILGLDGQIQYSQFRSVPFNMAGDMGSYTPIRLMKNCMSQGYKIKICKPSFLMKLGKP